MQKKKQERQKFHKDIERILYKFDHKIPEEYKNIEPNILLALICFFLILKKENISTIIYNAYYPLRNELKAYLVKKEKISVHMFKSSGTAATTIAAITKIASTCFCSLSNSAKTAPITQNATIFIRSSIVIN